MALLRIFVSLMVNKVNATPTTEIMAKMPTTEEAPKALVSTGTRTVKIPERN